MITDTATELMSTIYMTERDWIRYKVERDLAKIGIFISYNPAFDSEPTEIEIKSSTDAIRTLRSMGHPQLLRPSDTAFKSAIIVAACFGLMAFVLVGSW